MMSDFETYLMKDISSGFKYGNMIEREFKGLYKGGFELHQLHMNIIADILRDLVVSGFLSYHKASHMIKYITSNVVDNSYLSTNSEHVILIDKLDETDDFELEDLMKWFVYELTQDGVFLYHLNGNNSYAGVREFLNNSKITKNTDQDFDSYTDFVKFKNKSFFTVCEDSVYELRENVYSSDTVPVLQDNMKLIVTDLLDGHIYWNVNSNYIMVNLQDNKFCILDVDKCNVKITSGRGIDMLPNNYILVSDSNNKLSLVKYDESSVVIQQEICMKPGYIRTSMNGFSVRSYDCDNHNACRHFTYQAGDALNDKYCKEFDRQVVWKNVIDNCFDFNLKVVDKMSDRLFHFTAYQPPISMSVENVNKKINSIIRHIESNNKGNLGKEFSKLVLFMMKVENIYAPKDDIFDVLKKEDFAICKHNSNEFKEWNEPCLEFVTEEIERLKKISLDKMVQRIDAKIAELELEEEMERQLRKELDE